MFKGFWLTILWIKEAFQSIYRNMWKNIIIFVLTLISLLLFSLSYIVSENAQYLAKVLDNKVEIKVEIKESIPLEQHALIEEQLKEMSGIKEVVYASKEQSLETMKKEMGENADVIDILEENPFPAYFQIKLTKANEVEKVAKKIEGLQIAESVQYGSEYVEKLLSLTSFIKNIFSGIAIGTLIMTTYMIISFIKLNIDQKRKEIEIKYLAGASGFTVRIPFMLEAIFITCVAAISVFALYYYGYNYGVTLLKESIPYAPFLPMKDMAKDMFVYLLTFGFGIGLVGSVFSTQRFLKQT